MGASVVQRAIPPTSSSTELRQPPRGVSGYSGYSGGGASGYGGYSSTSGYSGYSGSDYPGMKRMRVPQATVAVPSSWHPGQVQPASITRDPQMPYRIKGERFFVEREGETYYIRHPLWSLLGAGASLAEAEHDLRREASQLVHVLNAMSPATLDYEALRLFRFVLRIG